MGCWPGTDLRVCLKCRLQILCTKSLQEYPWPQESLSDFLQLWMLLLTCSSEQSNTYNCLWMQWEGMQLHVTDLKQNPQMCIQTTKMSFPIKHKHQCQKCFTKLLLKENSSMDVTLFTSISHKLPYAHLTLVTYEWGRKNRKDISGLGTTVRKRNLPEFKSSKSKQEGYLTPLCAVLISH